jgi:signal transduction histidine kinase
MLEELYGSLNENQKEYLRIINSSAEDVLTFFNDLLNFSVLEQGKLVLKKNWISIGHLLNEMVLQSEAYLKTARIAVTLDIAPNLPEVYADEQRLRQAVGNVYDNALKFTAESGFVHIAAEVENEKLRIQISDNGVGIEPAELDLVFKEFYQAEDAYQKFHSGIGLGLPIAMNLIHLHDGSIDIISRPGAGTTVTILLPVGKGLEDEIGTDHSVDKGNQEHDE